MVIVSYIERSSISVAYSNEDPLFSEVVEGLVATSMRDLGIDPDMAYIRFFSLDRLERILSYGTDRDCESPHRSIAIETELGIGPADYTYLHKLPDTYAIGETGLAKGTHGIAVYNPEKVDFREVGYVAIFRSDPLDALRAVIIPNEQCACRFCPVK